MVNEGVVLEINKGYIIVLGKDGDYIKLKYKSGSYEGQRIYFTSEDILKEKIYKRLSVVAACILIILIPAFIFMSMPANIDNVYAAAVVSVDINPSIEFLIDNNGLVMDMNIVSEDAKELVDMGWRGNPYSEVLEKYLKAAEEKGYIKENDVVVFACTVIDDNIDAKKIEQETEEAISKIEKKVSYTYSEANKETLEKAREKKLSLGKYELYQEIMEHNPEFDIRKLEKEDIKNIIKETRNTVRQNSKEEKSNDKNKEREAEKNKDDKDKTEEKNKNRDQIKPVGNDKSDNKDKNDNKDMKDSKDNKDNKENKQDDKGKKPSKDKEN